MPTVYIRERSFHTPQSLSEKLGIDEDMARLCIEVLTTRGVLKLKSGNEFSEYDVEGYGSVEGTYQFEYVGLVLFKDLVIVVYPKYLDERSLSEGKLRSVFRVIRKYAGSKSQIAALSDEGRRANDRLALMLTLLERYGDYGLYENQVRTLRTNGNGSISWERTIAKHQPYMNNSQPVYIDYETVERTSDSSNYVTRLHRYVLTACSRFMSECGLSDILSLVELELSDEDLIDFGDKQYVNYRIDQERRQQFVTWKQEVLGLLSNYVNEDEAVVQSDECICLGTSSFHVIWEKSCKVAFDDLLDLPLSNLGIPLAQGWRERAGETLLTTVYRPQWFEVVDFQEEEMGAVKTLVPDTVAIQESPDGQRMFCIFDAKYYVPTMGRSPHGLPGVESVAKQFLYQDAYRQFVLDHGFARVVNAFLIPGDVVEPKLVGKVRFPGIFSTFEAPFSDAVDMWLLPADAIYRAYLNDRPTAMGLYS